MGIEKEREAFEDWYCKNHTGLKQSDLAKFRTLSGYSFSDSLKINISWEAWQAAKAQSEKALLEQFEINNKLVEQIEKLKAKAQAVPDGFVLVPKEPTDAMLKASWDNLDAGSSDEFWDVYRAVIEAAQEPAND